MAANIPLHCNICPRKPNFSDVSHLLTHIASKGHLSNYYKVKVRSGSEESSRRLIETYDRWYTEWNVEELMSERMNQKDKRRSRARPTVRATPAPRIEAPRPARPRAAPGTLLDPRLSEHLIKVEHTTAPTPAPQSGPMLRRRAFAPHIQYWSTESRGSSRSYTNPDYETSSEYSDPSERRRYHYAIRDSCAIEDDPADDDAPGDTMAVSECTKLKGVYWPGMDIFDSATPEMRRKRNQKKDSSVLEQLEINSQEVEPTELIFTPTGTFKRQRRISSSVYDDDDESPVRLESPRQALTRMPLASVDANIPRRARQPTQTAPHFPLTSRRGHEEEYTRADYGCGYGDRNPKRKRTFDVFEDDDVSFSQPSGFNYLTAGLHPLPSPTPAHTVPAYKNFGSGFHFENKENPLPALHTNFEPHHPHPHQPAVFYHSYGYNLSHEPSVFQYNPNLYVNSGYQQQNHDDDENRTITAPPSPCTG